MDKAKRPPVEQFSLTVTETLMALQQQTGIHVNH